MTKISETKNSTLSKLESDGTFLCFIIEDGHREIKEYSMTRIPEGTYEIIKRKWGRFYKRYTRRFGFDFVPELINVPNFTDILIHCGNTVKDTSGCLLPNMKATIEDDNFKGEQSSKAYELLHLWIRNGLRKGKVTLEIKR